MHSDRIRALIEEGRTIERQTGLLRRAVIELAHGNGRKVTELQVQKVINFITEYIEHASALMKLVEESASRSDVLQHVQPILDTTDDYFLSADDTIPDRLGLVGLLDDAYWTHRLMETISDTYKSQSGRSLLPLETHKDSAFVRRLIGEPFVSILDDRIAATLAGPDMQGSLDQMMTALEKLKLSSGRDPIWGAVRAPEIADTRLAPIGFS